MSDKRNYFTRLRERRRERRAERAYWRWQDAEQDHRDWAFSRARSENHRNGLRVERLEATYERLREEADRG
jgi:hypothetical protein